MSEVKSDLDRAAREIRQRGISGWGNTCEEAAQRIRELEERVWALKTALHLIRNETEGRDVLLFEIAIDALEPQR